MDSTTMLATARNYLREELSVLPASKEKKFPLVKSWKVYQDRCPTMAEIDTWFAQKPDALCLVAGSVSGGLLCIDFDQKAEQFEAWRRLIPEDLYRQLVVEETQSGGRHVVVRTLGGVGGNEKLSTAMRDGKQVTLIETRGQGGLFLCAPSDGYRLLQGSMLRLPVLQKAECDKLLDAARSLSETAHPSTLPPQPVPIAPATLRPGDDFNARGSISAALAENGWRLVQERDTRNNEHWCRPGKDGRHTSATFDGNVFYMFSSNAAPFEPNRGYSKFHVLALLKFGGDFAACARALASEGYGAIASPEGFTRPEMGGLDERALQAPQSPAPKESEYPDPGPLPDALLDVPGFVNDLIGHTLATAYYPNRTLAFCGALAMTSLLAARQFKTESGTRPNLYLVALADSGTGKEWPRVINKRLGGKLEIHARFGDAFASGEGLEDSLFVSPAMLYQVDEMDHLLNSIRDEDARSEAVSGAILRFYGASSSLHIMRKKALGKTNVTDGFIMNPSLSILGTAIPKYFYSSLTMRALENGLVGRCLILEAGTRGRKAHPVDQNLPMALVDRARAILGETPMTGRAVAPNERTVFATPEANAAIRRIDDECDDRYERFHRLDRPGPMALWARAGEKVSKLSLLYAVSANPSDPVITEEAVHWAWALVEHATRRMLYMADDYTSDGVYDAAAKKLLRIVKAANGKIAHSQLLRHSHMRRDEFLKVMETLYEAGQLTSFKQNNVTWYQFAK